jgi:hypothetical protein
VNQPLIAGIARQVVLLADDAPRNSGPDFGKASPFGLLVVVLLGLGTVVLVWSMNRQLRKLPGSFDPEPADTAEAAEQPTVIDDSDSPTPDVTEPGDSPHEPSA